MSKWPIGVFTSVDAGLGVHLDVAQELKVPTVQVHAPHKQTRTRAAADQFLARCREAGITVTVVFGGFDGESYADIPTTADLHICGKVKAPRPTLSSHFEDCSISAARRCYAVAPLRKGSASWISSTSAAPASRCRASASAA